LRIPGALSSSEILNYGKIVVEKREKLKNKNAGPLTRLILEAPHKGIRIKHEIITNK